MNSLPLFIYTAYETDAPNALTRAFGAASVLLGMVLALFVAARWLSRDKTTTGLAGVVVARVRLRAGRRVSRLGGGQ
jgi:phosphate transport system permease protein